MRMATVDVIKSEISAQCRFNLQSESVTTEQSATSPDEMASATWNVTTIIRHRLCEVHVCVRACFITCYSVDGSAIQDNHQNQLMRSTPRQDANQSQQSSSQPNSAPVDPNATYKFLDHLLSSN